MKSALRHRPRLLLIGPRPRIGEPIGGTQVSFSDLCESFALSGRFKVDVVDTTRPNAYARGWRRSLGNAIGWLKTMAAILQRGPLVDAVMFNASSSGIVSAGPWVLRAARWIRKPLVIRAFGGSLDLTLDRASPRTRERLLATLHGAALVLLQTEHLCARFAGGGNIRKLPTTRRTAVRPRSRDGVCRRFVFMSQLRPEKGYDEALKAIELCPADCTLDIYGPSLPSTDLLRLRSHPRAVYHGAAAHEHVGRILSGYDALVFPSYYEGEGLPGVVVEALQCGLPVVATQWRALPELVAHEHNGLLVAPKSHVALAIAMTRLANDRALYAELCIGANERGRELDASSWHQRLESWLLEACGRDPASVEAQPTYREVSP